MNQNLEKIPKFEHIQQIYVLFLLLLLLLFYFFTAIVIVGLEHVITNWKIIAISYHLLPFPEVPLRSTKKDWNIFEISRLQCLIIQENPEFPKSLFLSLIWRTKLQRVHNFLLGYKLWEYLGSILSKFSNKLTIVRGLEFLRTKIWTIET